MKVTTGDSTSSINVSCCLRSLFFVEMSSLGKPLHQYISNNPPVSNFHSWLINKSVSCLLQKHHPTQERMREIICYDFDPYLIAPKTCKLNGSVAHGQLGQRLLKSTLTKRQNEEDVCEALDSLNNLLRNHGKGAEALHLNITFQFRCLLDHKNAQIKQKALGLLLILAGQPKGRLIIAKDKGMMDLIIKLMKDSNELVEWTAHQLVLHLSTYYCAVPTLLKLSIIPLIMDTLKEIIYASNSENFLVKVNEDGEEENEFEKDNGGEEIACEYVVEEAAIGIEAEVVTEGCSVDVGEKVSRGDILATLLETLIYLMGSNEDVTLDTICYDALLLKYFLAHENTKVRILTMNIFKQIFTTEIGRLALVPHDLLNCLIDAFWRNPNDEEQREALGVLMLSLMTPDNRAAAYNCGMTEKVIEIAKQPNVSSTNRLAALNVLSHLAEIPSARELILDNLREIALSHPINPLEEYSHHLQTTIDYAMWEL